MLTWTKEVLGSVWAAIVVEIVLQGILQSVPFNNTPLIESVKDFSPIGAALLPWLLYGISVFYALIIINYIYKWVIDRYQGGPKRRAFSALYSDIDHCKTQLIIFDNPYSPYRAEQTLAFSNYITIVSLLDKLRVELHKKDIDIPILDINIRKQRQSMVGFLSVLAVYAKAGDIDRVHVALRDFNQRVD